MTETSAPLGEVPEPDAEGVIHVDPRAAPESDDSIPDDEPADMKTVRKLRYEAATNRIKAKELQAKVEELEGAAARAAALEHAEVERVAAEQLIDADDIWRVPAETQQGWYDEEFNQLQPDKVRESVEALVAAKPHLARAATPPPSKQPLEGLRPGASPELKETKVTWSSALHRR